VAYLNITHRIGKLKIRSDEKGEHWQNTPSQAPTFVIKLRFVEGVLDRRIFDDDRMTGVPAAKRG
jgi:hypothetical protein